MRRMISATAVIALVLLTGLIAPPAHAEVSFDFFYSNLSPHGSWLVSAQYGRVWQPREYRPGWNPYYDGHWVYADVGWTWLSDYTWGSVPYHYGTWVLDPMVGWVWVPGMTWAPSWVVWRTGPEAIGWAPVPPEFAIGVSLGAAPPAAASFVFVSNHDFVAPRIGPCVIPEARRATILEHTTPVRGLAIENDVVVNRGPDVRVVERASGRTLRPARVESVARVAPFASVRREKLAIAADHGGPHVRAAQPVSARHPLPPSNERVSVMPERSAPAQHATPHVPRQGEAPVLERTPVAPHAPPPAPHSAPPPVQAPQTHPTAPSPESQAPKSPERPSNRKTNKPQEKPPKEGDRGGTIE